MVVASLKELETRIVDRAVEEKERIKEVEVKVKMVRKVKVEVENIKP